MTGSSTPGRDAVLTPPRLELRLERGRVRVGLGPAAAGAGLVAVDLEMEVHGAPASFDPGGGTGQFRALPCSLVRLEVRAAPEAAAPGPDALAELLAAALAPTGWPTPDASGLCHAWTGEGVDRRAVWRRPGAEAMALLEAAADARARGEPDAPLRLALAGQAALASGLPVEGEAALRTALDMGLERDDARDAWTALLSIARERGDEDAERHVLARLAPIAPTGQRPALLLRQADLDRAADDLPAARTHAEEARTLAPRDPAATASCLDLARRAGDGPAVIDLLERLATLDPASAGARTLERARLLAAAGRFQEADAALAEAVAQLAPDRALADEHVALRRGAPEPVSRLPWGEPLETFASRAADPAEAAAAYRDAALAARAQGDLPAALRAARQAHERASDVRFAGEILASLLHAGGSVTEALALHEDLLARGLEPLEPAVEAERLAALAELAEEAGHAGLAVDALDRLLDLRPHDAEAVEWRFRVDPDRARALGRLASDAERLRSRRRRARLLARAAHAARAEARDPAREAELLRRAGEAAAGLTGAELEVTQARLAAARASFGARAEAGGADPGLAVAREELVAALHAAAAALDGADLPEQADALREEEVEVAVRGGQPERATAALSALEERAAGRGDLARAGALARRAARLLLDQGDGAAAERVLRRATGRNPEDAGAWGDLEAIALARGDAGAPLLAEILRARAGAAEGAARTTALVSLARVQRGALGDPEGALATLREAVETSPGDASAEAELDRLLASAGRLAELGRTLLDRSAREHDPDERARLRLRAGEVLSDSGDDETRALAVPALLAVLAEPPPGRAPLLEAAARLAALGHGNASAPYLLALCRSDPFDGAAAQAVARALASDPAGRAEAFVAIAGETPPGPVRASHLREAAAAYAEAGDGAGLRAATRAAFHAWPVDDLAFRSALADASGDVDATDGILARRAAEVPAEAAACHLARADLLLSAGRPGPAARAYEAVVTVDPADASALSGLAEARAAEGDGPGALAAARRAAELALAQGRVADRRRALEAGAQVAASQGDRGEDAATILETLARMRLQGGEAGNPEVAALVSRAADALAQAGEDLRASELLSLAARSLPEEPSAAADDVQGGEEPGPALDLEFELEPLPGAAPAGTPSLASSPAPSPAPPPSPVPVAAPAPPPPGAGAGIADLLRPLLASARALADSGELGAAYARLKLAREIDPDHLEVTLGLARVAEKLGHVEEAVSLGEAHAEAISVADPAGAAARYRELSEVARTRLSDPARAAELLGKAVALEPHDPDLPSAGGGLRASHRDHATDLLARHLGSLRDHLADTRAARAVAILSRELAGGDVGPDRHAHAERGAVAEGLARFVQRIGPAAQAADRASRLDASIRSEVAAPGADGPTAHLLVALAPYLEPLFPVDLGRFGVEPADRVAPGTAPVLHGALDAATKALGGRPLALFLGRRQGPYAALENTRPPSLVVSAEIAALPPGAFAFVAARSVALAMAGFTLLGKFAPRDVLILCELSARFAGGAPGSRTLPPDRAAPFLAALERSVPPSMRDWLAGLGPASAAELPSLAPAALVSALERTADRLALLHTGDLHGALDALSRLHRPGPDGSLDPAALLDRPAQGDLARFALSDRYLELRGMLLGWP